MWVTGDGGAMCMGVLSEVVCLLVATVDTPVLRGFVLFFQTCAKKRTGGK